jgi:hypothetical protein
LGTSGSFPWRLEGAKVKYFGTACLALILTTPGTALAQLTTDQRIHEFQNLVSLYAKRYGPYAWKQQALGFSMFDTKPWLDRIRAAKDDLE